MMYRLLIWAYRLGYRAGYTNAIADLSYSPESRKALFHLMTMDAYKPRRTP